MNDDKYSVVEWKMENLSCWIGEVHGNVITSPMFGLNYVISLFPKGLNTTEEKVEMKIIDDLGNWGNIDNLTLLRSDGSTIFDNKGKILTKDCGGKFKLGISFKELRYLIKKSPCSQKDELTLRFQWKKTYSSVHVMHTTIDVFDTAIKISRKTFDDIKSEKSRIFYFTYPLDKGVRGELVLMASKGEYNDSKVILTLKALIQEKNVFVLTRVCVLNEKDVVKKEKNEHLFSRDEEWSFSNSLTREEVLEEGFGLILYIKIIPNSPYKHLIHTWTCKEIEAVSLPSNASEIPDGTFTKSSSDVSVQPSNSITVLTKELMSLYQDSDHSDFELSCEKVSFSTHKAILSSRSPVFKRMLSGNLEEARSGIAVIEDLDVPTLTRFLAFLYTGIVEELDGENAIKLYYAADKYQVPTLKRECANFLRANLSIANVGNVLSLADKTQDKELTEAAHDFLLKNYDGVLKSEEWVSFIRNEPLLAAETLTQFSRRDIVEKMKVHLDI